MFRIGFLTVFASTLAVAQAQTDPGPVNLGNREETRAWFNQWWPQSHGAASGFTGDVASGNAGDTSQAFKNQVLLRANIYRRMAREQPLQFNPTYSAMDQKGALIIVANFDKIFQENALDDTRAHNPAASYTFYSQDGATALQNSNVAGGDYGPSAITDYIWDTGQFNTGVLHRSNLLDPVLLTVGTGDIPPTTSGNTSYPAANVFWGQAPTGQLNYSGDYVAWPTPGYVPQVLIPGRWSIKAADLFGGYGGVQFDFSSATVNVTKDGVSLPVSVIVNNYGLIFTLDGSNEGVGANIPSTYQGEDMLNSPVLTTEDVTYHVSVSGVKTTAGSLYNGTGTIAYDVIAFNPDFGVAAQGQGANLINISTRSFAGAGSATQIAGFIINGSAPRKVLIRAGGPYLTQFGVSNVLADPVLTLFDGQTSIISNDDWSSDAANISAVSSQVGAVGFASGSKDAAIVTTLQPGHQYTAQVTGKSGATGNTIVEVYDADASNASSKLINISTRSFVGTGASIQIGGFILHGNGPRTVLIRAGGPYLSQFGVSGVLNDPVLTVFKGQTQIAQNDDWGSDAANVSSAVSTVGAVAFTQGSKDAALVLTLDPDTPYTAQVAGKNGGTGNALIEIFAFP